MTDRASGVQRAARRARCACAGRCCRSPTRPGIVEFARGLAELGVELVSTGGTARELAGAGVPVRAIEDFTGFPEMMDGRVKTLHPRLYAGLLARRDSEEHLRAAAEQRIEQVDLVCVNLYPFEQTVARGDASEEEVIENIDIGGPTMIRAAAKNSAFAAVVVDPRRLRARARRAARVRRPAVAAPRAKRWPARRSRAPRATTRRSRPGSPRAEGEGFPPSWRDAYEKVMRPALRREPPPAGRLLRARGLPHAPAGGRRAAARQGAVVQQPARPRARRASWWRSSTSRRARSSSTTTRAAARSATARREAYERAFACDPQSAYGGVIAVNRPVDVAFAQELGKQFIEVLLAPGYDADALEALQVKKNVRLLELGDWPAPAREVEAKPVIGGQLVQTRDVVAETREQMQVMSAQAAERGGVAGHAVRVDGLPPRALQRDRARARRRGARRSGSAPGR